MRRTLVLLVGMAFLVVSAAPAAAAGKPMPVTGSETFFLTPTCDPGPPINLGPSFSPACKQAGPNTTITVSNPGSRTGTFEGDQHFEGTITVFSNLDFVFRGTLTFTGSVEGCGEGTVVFFNEGYGNFATGLERNVQHIVPGKGTLSVKGKLQLVGTSMNTNDIFGTYHC